MYSSFTEESIFKIRFFRTWYKLSISPFKHSIYFNRGLTKSHLEDYRGANADYTKSIEINPQYAEALFNRGLSNSSLVQKDSGCLDFSKASELGYSKAYDAIKDLCQYFFWDKL